jgi:hypothetical protein
MGSAVIKTDRKKIAKGPWIERSRLSGPSMARRIPALSAHRTWLKLDLGMKIDVIG